MTTHQQINLIPAAVQVRVAIGASVGLRLRALDQTGAIFDPTPYTVTAPFSNGDAATPPIAGWTVTVEGVSILLNLSPADTALLAPAGRSTSWHWDVWLVHATAPERMLYAHGDLGLLIP